MTEYVKINTSVPEILSTAGDLVAKGADLQTTMKSLVDEITHHEGASTWGSDHFTDEFLKRYAGKDAASDSAKDVGSGENALGNVVQTLGTGVVNAMFNYSDTDIASAADIDDTAS
jgi:hypothetical protein